MLVRKIKCNITFKRQSYLTARWCFEHTLKEAESQGIVLFNEDLLAVVFPTGGMICFEVVG